MSAAAGTLWTEPRRFAELLRGKQKKWLAPMNRMGCGILAAATEKEL